eukprot:3760049-Rhodomonas_salina.1
MIELTVECLAPSVADEGEIDQVIDQVGSVHTNSECRSGVGFGTASHQSGLRKKRGKRRRGRDRAVLT